MTKDELKAYFRLTGIAHEPGIPAVSSSWITDKYQVIFRDFVDNGKVAIYIRQTTTHVVDLPFNEVPEFLNDEGRIHSSN